MKEHENGIVDLEKEFQDLEGDQALPVAPQGNVIEGEAITERRPVDSRMFMEHGHLFVSFSRPVTNINFDRRGAYEFAKQLLIRARQMRAS